MTQILQNVHDGVIITGMPNVIIGEAGSGKIGFIIIGGQAARKGGGGAQGGGPGAGGV